VLHAAQVQESFVNGINLYGRSQLPQCQVHALGHIPVKGKIGRKYGHLVFFYNIPDLVKGNTHCDAQGLGFVAARYGTPVVVGQNNDRTSVQARVEYPFTTDEEIIAIGQRIHGQSFLIT